MMALLAGMLVGLGGFVISSRKFRIDMAKDREAEREKAIKSNEALALRVCREFTTSDEFWKRRDAQIAQMIYHGINEEFIQRSPSFVGTEKFDERLKSVEEKIGTLAHDVRENTREVANLGGQVTTAVTQQLTAYLSTRVFGDETLSRRKGGTD